MTLDPRPKNIKTKRNEQKTKQPKTKFTKENYEKLKKLTGTGFTKIYTSNF